MIEVRDAPEHGRYEILVDGEPAGHTRYHDREGSLIFDHTRIYDGFAGRGLASALVGGAVDGVRAQGRQLVPVCEFMAAWMAKHPDQDDVVDHVLAERIRAGG